MLLICRFFLPSDTPSGSIVKRTLTPKSESPILMDSRVSTVGWCCWTSPPWEHRPSTTSCWNLNVWPNWPTSIVSGATWVTRTSSPWSAWSILNFFILWRVAGTDSCAPGGGTTDTAMCFSCTITVMDLSTSTTETVTHPYQMTKGGSGNSLCDFKGNMSFFKKY